MRDLFNAIQAFALRNRKDSAYGEDRIEWTKQYALALHREVSELLDEVPWKPHRTYPDLRVYRDNIAEEVVDIIFFAWSALGVHGITYEQMEEAMVVKLAVIENRWREEKTEASLISPKGIALIDIDGVLCQYPLRREGQGKVEWEREKHDWRSSGATRHFQPIISNLGGVKFLAEAGYDIVLLSKRPAHRYKRLVGDTLYWLKTYNVPFKRLIFTEDKSLKVALNGWAHAIQLAVDDDPDNVDQLRDLGLKVYQVGMFGEEYEKTGRERTMLDIPEVQEWLATDQLASGQ